MSQIFSLKGSSAVEQPARIAAARDRMLSGAMLPDNTVRSVIEASWQRCLAKDVDPRIQQRERLNDRDLEQLWQQDEELISASDIIMNEAHQLLADSGTIMHLVAPSGVILRCDGDPATLDLAQDFSLIPGVNWQEQAAGTNAIGTALSVNASVQVHAYEHFCDDISCWTCSAAVIRDPFEKSIRGAVNISGLKHTQHDYCLALAISGARRIEGQLAQFQLARRDLLLGLTVDRFARNISDGVLLFDANGRMLRANGMAERVLAIRGIQADLTPYNPLLSLGSGDTNSSAVPLLALLDVNWIEPVLHAGDTIGHLAVIPLPFERSARATETAPESLGFSGESSGFARIAGHSALIQATIAQAKRLAQAPIPILLQGETGVGKELFARAIHETGPTRNGTFVALNCGGLSRDLLAAELFGYVDGAFTGARRGGMQGKIEAANGGTLFLDEIGEMPLDLQPMFLRVLQESEICRVGETTPRKVNFRLVAATNRDMTQEVAEGRFRMDLFYRVSSMGLRIPPLRERRDDIGPLAQHLLARLAREHNREPKGLSPELLLLLHAHDWPGNIRELANTITTAFFLSESDALTPEDLAPEFKAVSTAAVTEQGISPLELAEREMIAQAIREQGGNLTQVAKQLQIAKSTLYIKLKKYDLGR
ncbi:sigma-54-dependent Fis family transcriptional regulator [Marinobacterium zhoushanense]|uniref:Sigma-54-dependent Fis family transcriptional regulator n=1 Tax=Marinobacterium zhoushanense TaxID=1679163 RepID=A0ABQ1KD77_9GAMM|nr:sigma-54-dependent Fis family transcriptional regulator [Marinobacterium zhoushanense]GGB95819.1 sigma-54-dependent Fis family transcriptional regulator [Marinobacterium zhoushanense]